MNIIRQEHNDKTEFILNYNDNNFIIHYAGCDLYWTMIDYKNDNQFVVTSSSVNVLVGSLNVREYAIDFSSSDTFSPV